MSHSEPHASPLSRRVPQARVVPLARYATLGGERPEAPNLLISKRQAVPCASAVRVVETCCRNATAAFRRLAPDVHSTAECDILCCRVNKTLFKLSCGFRIEAAALGKWPILVKAAPDSDIKHVG